MVRRLSITQKQLLETAFNILKDNGTLVYSTCSLEPEENEAVVDFLLNKYENAELEEIKIKHLKKSSPIMNFEDKKDEVSDLLGDLADTSDSKEDGELNTDKEFSNMDDVFDEVMKDDD